MARALLLDLDDTLLRNSMKDFLPNYFDGLTAAVSDYMAAEPFLRALHHAVQQMIANTDLSQSNESIFWQAFEPLLTVNRATLEPVLDRFYEERFPALVRTTAPVAGSQALLDAAKAADCSIVIATNPLFPRLAIEHRIQWAGLDEKHVDLITAYENMSSTKPHASYFAQIANMLCVAPQDCVMAGNHLTNDLVGAAAIGMKIFWVDTYPVADAEITPDGQGSLIDLRLWLFGES